MTLSLFLAFVGVGLFVGTMLTLTRARRPAVALHAPGTWTATRAAMGCNRPSIRRNPAQRAAIPAGRARA